MTGPRPDPVAGAPAVATVAPVPTAGLLGLRVALAALGVLAGLYGALALVSQVPLGQLWPVLRWAVLAVVVSDAVLAPAGVVVGWLLFRRAGPRVRAVGRAGLIGIFVLVLLTVARIGALAHRQNPTALGVDPLTGLLVGVAALLGAAAALLLVSRRDR